MVRDSRSASRFMSIQQVMQLVDEVYDKYVAETAETTDWYLSQQDYTRVARHQAEASGAEELKDELRYVLTEIGDAIRKYTLACKSKPKPKAKPKTTSKTKARVKAKL